ncbi:MAG: adenine deaminase [Dehalococcoidia bacterium]|nr:adenine deaminase [Dehalococcoidia bacterium]MDW8119377.1 adenine deaminase [Chloroflexota bacterium]
MNLQRLIAVARGDAPADLVLRNARIVNTFTGEIEEGHVAIAEGRIAGIGDYQDAHEVLDLQGRWLAPGLIDGHYHLESTYLTVDQYARAVVPRGTLGCVTDLHEVANVCGLRGMRWVMACARRVPLDMFFMAPSCVPATHMETSGATLGPAEVRQALRWKEVLGLGEMMNFPAVIQADPYVLAKISAARGRVRDGHAPRVTGKALNAYLAPLIGSDHETTHREEGKEKLRRGMYLMIREGSSEKNLEDLLPLVNEHTYRRCMLVVDDRTAKDIYKDGDVDAVVRKAIRLGLDPVMAITMATLVPATYFRLEGLGGIAPGYWANLLVLDDLRAFRVERVYYRGRLVAHQGRPLFTATMPKAPWMWDTVHIKPFTPADLAIRWGERDTVPVMEIVPGQIITRWVEERPLRRNGTIVADPQRDLLKLAVVERHKATGNIGLGLVKGFGLQRGALATSVAHDSHNIVVVGVSDEDILTAVREIERLRGGLTVVAQGKVLGSLALPIAGLLSPEPLEKVAQTVEELERLAGDLGCRVASPFAVLSFLALPVIPELKLTDRGLVDVMAGRFVQV